jgi:hypothetical protein
MKCLARLNLLLNNLFVMFRFAQHPLYSLLNLDLKNNLTVFALLNILYIFTQLRLKNNLTVSR